MQPNTDEQTIHEFQNSLLSWYEHNKRDLPWRQDQDPYKVWVSEIMLQQTKVDTVIPYFHHFMTQFPTPEDLAYADEEQVMKAWEGLGYYSRVRNLQTAVKEVVEEYGGKVPEERTSFSSLKGVGPYTAGAVLSIAYEKPEPAVDGNVMRVFSRIFNISDDIGKAKTRKRFESLVAPFLEDTEPSRFNQAVMELGALVCTPKSPGCLLCPVQEFCEARKAGTAEDLPVKPKKKAPKAKDMAAAVVKNEYGQILIHQRGESGLLARLWEFPNIEVPEGRERIETLEHYLAEEYGVNVQVKEPVQKVEHVFSHLIWYITVFEAWTTDSTADDTASRWVSWEETAEYAFPVSHQKILEEQKEKEASSWI
ncbi:A/G-specific adenine glycosylase [Salibacterium halotolerans]|uniref:Adenine DNA glycosylase n=1 Tax=Salibacterium halotolerans TaxID=1884432 RepID=A0A1I5RE82_9BACI|nr:A/G-specific adenine glycosylase [Salibacterium halotolerans]SFP56888.1 A/G-specific adenine glycosylase [Salibacterium halotolerans]